MRWATLFGLCVGLAVVAGLVAWQGVDTVLQPLHQLGWGFWLLPVIYIGYLSVAVAGWLYLFLPGRAPTFMDALHAMLIGNGIATLLPITTLGAEVVKARLLSLGRTTMADASASVVLDTTVQAITLVIVALIGVGLLVWLNIGSEIIAGALIGAVVLAGGIVVFMIIQRVGMFGSVARLVLGDPDGGRHQRWQKAADGAKAVDDTVRAVYDRPWRITMSIVLRAASRVLSTAEVWLIALIIGLDMSLWDAVMIRSLTIALRGAIFLVPSGFGVQEGSYVVLGGLVGIAPDIMLALSLASRGRELLVAIPATLRWQQIEGREIGRWARRRRGHRDDGDA